MTWHARIEAAFGATIVHARALGGGDISQVTAVTLADGRRLAAKHGDRVATEARMLKAMAAAGAPVPRVLLADDGLMCLQWLEETAPTRAAWAALGAGLRRLHDCTGKEYGWDEHYAFGPVAIDNGQSRDWPGFWADKRLLPGIDTLPASLARRIEALAAALPDRLPRHPAPSLLHGDIWIGNALFSGDTAWLVDPACYRGHGEVDLAMLALFGRPDPAFRDGYGDPTPGWEERLPIYQLWPAMVHAQLFGAGYHPMIARLLDAARA